MNYQYLTHSVGGFIQQAAVCYVQRGYYFYVFGQIKKDANLLEVDQKIMNKYQIRISKDQRYRRKQEGVASVQYLRYERTFLLLATHGKHQFFKEEKNQIKDARHAPIRAFGYMIQWVNDQLLVSIDKKNCQKLKTEMMQAALLHGPQTLAAKFWAIRFEPYSRVYKQIKSIWKSVNLRRRTAGLPPVPVSALRHNRRIYRPFEPEKPGKPKPRPREEGLDLMSN